MSGSHGEKRQHQGERVTQTREEEENTSTSAVKLEMMRKVFFCTPFNLFVLIFYLSSFCVRNKNKVFSQTVCVFGRNDCIKIVSALRRVVSLKE